MKRLGTLTVEKYGPQFLRFVRYAEKLGRSFLPAESSTVEMWLVNDLAGTVNANNIDTYIRPINTAHEENCLERPALGSHVGQTLDGIKQNQYRLAPETETRLWVPADAVGKVLDLALTLSPALTDRAGIELLRACTAVCVDYAHFSRGDTGSSMRPGEIVVQDGSLFMKQFKLKGGRNRAAVAARDATVAKVLSLPPNSNPDLIVLVSRYLRLREQLALAADVDSVYRLPWDSAAKFTVAKMNQFMTVAFGAAGVAAPPGFKYTWHMLRHGSASAAAALGVPERSIKDFGNWARKSDAYETYLHTVPATHSGRRFFGWMLAEWALAHPADAALVVPDRL